MTTFLHDDRGRSAVFTAVGLAVVWIVAAAVRPTFTYHLAPILVAGVVPVLARPPDRAIRQLLIGSALSLLVALVAVVALGAADLLRGPSLLPYGAALAESITFAVGGAVAGLIAAFVIPAADSPSGTSEDARSRS